MRLALFVITCLISFTMTSCSKRGFNKELLQDHIRDKPLELNKISEEDIKNAIEKKIEISTPIKLAIYFSEYKYYSYGTHHSSYDWKWTIEDKESILKSITDLDNKNIISDAFILKEVITDIDKVKGIRYAAAKAGADKVLIINGIFDMDFYGNGLGFTYVFLVTAFFVPGTISHGLFMVNATLWDVKEPIQYFSIENEGISKQIRPKALIGKGKLIKKSKTIALENLKNDLIIRLKRLNAK